MTFPSISFLFVFMPIFLLGYGLLSLLCTKKEVPEGASEPQERPNSFGRVLLHLWTIFGSIYFYCSTLVNALVKALLQQGPMPELKQYLHPALLLLTCLFTYIIGILIGLTKEPYVAQYSRRSYVAKSPARIFLLIFSLIFLVLPLLYFKFHGPLPLGISFYTFMAISYVVDVYRGAKPEKNILDFSCYFLFFPKILQGPITRYSFMQPDLKSKKVNFDRLEHGIGMFILGLTLKVLLANKIASLWNTVWSAGPYAYGSLAVWFGAWGYAMQLYFDFWGYSLMAEGLGNILNIGLPQNFNHPYASKTFTSFWRRWHMTLGQWFRDYVYIPLGGSKNGPFLLIVSLFATWFLTGFWHGAKLNFLLWGMVFFVLLILEKFLYGKALEKTHVLGHLYVILILPLTWMIFAVSDPKLLLAYFKRLFFLPLVFTDAAGNPLNLFMDVTPLTGFLDLVSQYWWLMLIAILFSTPYPMKLYERFRTSFVVRLLLIILFWVSVWQVTKSGSNPFMYLSF